jgi:Tfp pilus assembly protein PilO
MAKITTQKAPGAEAPLEEQKEIIKRPSKIFTDYYGSLFMLMIIVYAGAGYLLIKPKIDFYKMTDAQTQASRQTIDNEKGYFDGLTRSVSAAQSIDTSVLDKVDKALPRTASVPDMLVQLGAAAAANNIMLSNIVFEGTNKAGAKGTAVQPINVTMAVAANDYQSFKNFMQDLEKSVRLYDVQNINFNMSPEGKVNFNLQMKTYFYAPAPTK